MADTVLMYSGGKDSILSACRMVSAGYRVKCLSIDNGCMSWLPEFNKSVERLHYVFGNKAERLKTESCAELRKSILMLRAEKDVSELALRYGNLVPYQLSCLECHTSMVVTAIRKCTELGVSELTTGSRKSQGFIVELQPMIDRYSELCRVAGVQMHTPVLELDSDYDRDIELASYGIIPKVMEAQCWSGMPIKCKMTQSNIDSLLKYYDNEIKPLCMDAIKTAVKRKID